MSMYETKYDYVECKPYKGFEIEKTYELDSKGKRVPGSGRYMVSEDEYWIGDVYKTIQEAHDFIDDYIEGKTGVVSSTAVTASLVDTFMKYHEDIDNAYRNEAGFDKMYRILDKYGDENESVDVVFQRATPEDQKEMIKLITPGTRYPGEKGYAQKMYYDALEGEYGREYGKGIVDAIEALFAEGWIKEDEFRTDL